tara:strand:+ start:306 stop:818 length:513 start_codon:yes stop_codon:yes gene_type:complete
MENEDYRIITLHDNKLKVYRDGRIEKYFIYKDNKRNRSMNRVNKEMFIKIGHNNYGYTKIVLSYNRCEKPYQAHRIIAYTFLGLDINNQKTLIDHIDRNKSNNNVVNLRIVTKQQNAFNTKSKGYFWDKSRNKWRTSICINNKQIHLGRYKTEAAARYAYLTAKAHYHQF